MWVNFKMTLKSKDLPLLSPLSTSYLSFCWESSCEITENRTFDFDNKKPRTGVSQLQDDNAEPLTTSKKQEALFRVCHQLVSTVPHLKNSLLFLVIAASDLPLHAIKCCSVIFGSVVEASCHKHTAVDSREQQTTQLTSDKCHQLAQSGELRQSCVYHTWRSNHDSMP